MNEGVKSLRIDKDIDFICDSVTSIFDCQVPFRSVLVPDRRREFVVELDEFEGIKLACASLNVC